MESEYIRNLQQQIYFLELEVEYLNEERKKLVTVPSSVSIEAERMYRKIKTMQSELHSRENEILDKESTINVLQQTKENTLSQLEVATDDFAHEKKELINQIVLLKKDVERLELDGAKKSADLEGLALEHHRAVGDWKAAEVDKNHLQLQLDKKTEEFNNLRLLHEESRTECVKLKTNLQELEDRFFHSKVRERENVDGQLKEDIKRLRYELREKELQSEQDRTLRLKISDDCAALVKENAGLSAQVIEGRKQLDMEKQFNEESAYRKSVNTQELVTLKEERVFQERELLRYKELYEAEQEKYMKLMEKHSVEEEEHARARLQRTKLQAELEEVGGLKTIGSQENVGLRRDNLLLSDQVTELQVKVRTRDDEIDNLQAKVLVTEQENANLKTKYRLQSSIDQIKWDEFENMADQMKNLSRHLSPVRYATESSPRREREFET